MSKLAGGRAGEKKTKKKGLANPIDIFAVVRLARLSKSAFDLTSYSSKSAAFNMNRSAVARL
jgi:hypothetical protein